MKPSVEFVGIFETISKEVLIAFPDGRESIMRYGSHAAAQEAKQRFESNIAAAPEEVDAWRGGTTLLTYIKDGKSFHSGREGWYECIPIPDYERVPDDGRCAQCEGWGCCACSHTGGY